MQCLVESHCQLADDPCTKCAAHGRARPIRELLEDPSKASLEGNTQSPTDTMSGSILSWTEADTR